MHGVCNPRTIALFNNNHFVIIIPTKKYKKEQNTIQTVLDFMNSFKQQFRLLKQKFKIKGLKISKMDYRFIFRNVLLHYFGSTVYLQFSMKSLYEFIRMKI